MTETTADIVIGLGNVTLTDDGAGPLAAREVARRLAARESAREDSREDSRRATTVVELGLGGLALMEAMVGHRRAVVLDALRTGRVPVGTVVELPFDHLGGSLHETSVHDLSLSAALEIGRIGGLPLPDDIHVLGIEVEDVTTFGETLTPAVADGLDGLVDRVLDLLASSDRPSRRTRQ
ncbi:MAG: hydrogenase maturation protease [Actinomycetota bacterium]|nr:hydrogenase maturation protease [Actinomycetota bacterium]